MCEFATAIAIGSAVVGGASALMQGQAAAAGGAAQQAAFDQQALAIEAAGKFEADQARRKARITQAAARAQVGASGVTVAGSPTEVLASNAEQNELDIQGILYNTRIQANQARTQGAIANFQGQQAKSASYLSAANNVFAGLKSVNFGGSAFAPKTPSRTFVPGVGYAGVY